MRQDRLAKLAATVAALALTALGVAALNTIAGGSGPRRDAARRRLGQASGHAAFSSKADRAVGTDHDRDVRPAGAEAMRDRPHSWSRADESSDESFPASDPPANY